MKKQTSALSNRANLTPKFYQQDLQLQTNYSDGKVTIDEIVNASIINGRTIIGITDHAIGWDEGDEHCAFFQTAQQFKNYLADIEIARQNCKEQGIRLLAGLEVEIGLDGQMALGKGILDVIGTEDRLSDYLDYVIGVIHSESFTVSLKQINEKPMDEASAALLVKNVQALIANPQVLIWGHPFQAVHGHFLRNFTTIERQEIVSSLRQRQTPLLLEYNLNPTPRYTEWGGKSTHYESQKLQPNDIEFFEACVAEGSKFVISTDAHTIEQTARLTAKTIIPSVIRNRLVYLE